MNSLPQERSESQAYSIYALIDPRDESVRYVGMSKQPYQRYGQHLTLGEKNEVKNAWIRELAQYDLIPILQIIDTAETLAEAKKKEAAWIRYHVELQSPLVNIAFPTGIDIDVVGDYKRLQLIEMYCEIEDERLNATDKAVLLILANYADRDGKHCFPSIPTIAKKSCASERSVQRSLKQLETCGYIIANRGVGRIRSEYTLTLPPDMLRAWDAKRKRLPTIGHAQEKIVEGHWDQLFEQ